MTAIAGVVGLKLPFNFDADLLRRDLQLVAADEWTAHYNAGDFGGEWRGVSLRSSSGSVADLGAGLPGAATFLDTPLLDRCRYFRAVLAHFQCPLKSVRLLSLTPGSFIREHSDHALDYEDGEVRLHIPVRTSPAVEFYVCGERLLLEEGRCYYVNVNLPHRVNNRGSEARVHLVIDAEVNGWVRDLFEGNARGTAEIPRCPLPPARFEEFADAIFADESLRDRLRAISDRARLLRATADEAAARGFDLNEADIEAAFRAGPQVSDQGTEGWIPIQVMVRDSQPWARWIYGPESSFSEPGFEDSVRACLRHPFTALFQRESPLPEGCPVRPDGIIFHLSRCGSTLISRSLAAAESNLLIAEAPPIDQIVQEASTNRPAWLARIVSALGRLRNPSQKHFLVKTDAWHVLHLSLFRTVFPDVPWIFVYREPLDILISLLRTPGLHACPGLMDPAALGLSEEDRTLSRLEWCARVLENFMTAALRFGDDPLGLFVNYAELPGAICSHIAGHFCMTLSAGDETKIQAAAKIDAKNPWRQFESDAGWKREQARLLERNPVIEGLGSLYRQLESARLSRIREK